MLFDVSHDMPPRDQPTTVFLALMPPPEIAEQFHADAAILCRRAGLVGRQRPPDILHMTLLSIGSAPGRAPRQLLEVVDTALNMMRFPAFDVVLDHACSFETRQDSVPFVLGGSMLAEVEAVRLAALSALRVRDLNIPAKRTFTGHMTLAYSSRRAPRIQVSPFRWTARDVWLVESWVGETKYVRLGRWTLWDTAPNVLPAWDGPRFRNAA